MDISSVNQSVIKAQYSSTTTRVSQSVVGESLNQSADEQHQKSLKLFDKLLTEAYSKISGYSSTTTTNTSAAVSAYGAFEPLTAEKVANNILGFIDRRLALDVSDGATAEQLQSRLEAGLSGFQKGFAEAQEQLKALSLLSPEIEKDIQGTYDRVTKGIEDLRLKYLSDLIGQ